MQIYELESFATVPLGQPSTVQIIPSKNRRRSSIVILYISARLVLAEGTNVRPWITSR
jgi:hypothetical protein